MPDNIHRCETMPDNMRYLVTDEHVYHIRFCDAINPPPYAPWLRGELTEMALDYIYCPYCGALLSKKGCEK